MVESFVPPKTHETALGVSLYELSLGQWRVANAAGLLLLLLLPTLLQGLPASPVAPRVQVVGHEGTNSRLGGLIVVVVIVESLIDIGSSWVHGSFPARPRANVVDADGPPGEGDPEATWRWIVYLRRRVQALEREVDTGKSEMIRIARIAAGAQKELDIGRTEMVKIAKVATAAQREPDIARGETRLLNKVINGLQQRLDRLEGRGSVSSDLPPLGSGSSDDSWGPGPGPGRAHAPGGAPRSRPSTSAPSLSAPSHHSAGCRNERVPPGSGSEEWRDEWLSAEYHNRRAQLRTPVRPRHPVPVPEPIPMAGGRYGGLRDEVPGGDVDWDIGGGEEELEEFGITPPRGVRWEAAERSRRRRDGEVYMEGVWREHLGLAYMVTLL